MTTICGPNEACVSQPGVVTQPSEAKEDGSDGLGTGEIVGIILGAMVASILIGVIIVLVVFHVAGKSNGAYRFDDRAAIGALPTRSEYYI